MISPWKRANIQRSFDSEPNYTRCAKECHVDPKTVHKYTDKGVVPKRPAQREYRTRIAPLDSTRFSRAGDRSRAAVAK